MGVIVEYHMHMRSWIPAPIRFASLILVALFFVPASHGQVNGPPASVASPGFGGHPINGIPPSVTSVGPLGYSVPNPRIVRPETVHHDHFRGRDGNDKNSRRRDNQNVGPLIYAVPVPYAVDDGSGTDNADATDPNEEGGPTVFDRRGSGPRSYVPPEKELTSAHQSHADRGAEDDPPAEAEPPQQPTLLVFKDGRTLEVGNYAIQGATLYDLTPGRRRKIALMDLDLEATRKQNDERGVMFQLPSSYKAN